MQDVGGKEDTRVEHNDLVFSRRCSSVDPLDTVSPLEGQSRVIAIGSATLLWDFPNLDEIAGQDSPLRRKHKVWLHRAGVANLPEDYAVRARGHGCRTTQAPEIARP